MNLFSVTLVGCIYLDSMIFFSIVTVNNYFYCSTVDLKSHFVSISSHRKSGGAKAPLAPPLSTPLDTCRWKKGRKRLRDTAQTKKEGREGGEKGGERRKREREGDGKREKERERGRWQERERGGGRWQERERGGDGKRGRWQERERGRGGEGCMRDN